MKKPLDGRELASEILSRSGCSVQVGAAIGDNTGLFSWGWNSPHIGYGQCAEKHAISRANRKRLRGSTIYVAGIRRRNGRFVPSKPCGSCQAVIDKWNLKVVWRDSSGVWNEEL